MLTCPACGSEKLTFTEVVPAHREGGSAASAGSDGPPPHDVPRTAYFVCERCDSPGQFLVPEGWDPPITA